MVKFFGIGKHAGELCMSEVSSSFDAVVRTGLDVVVATDDDLVDHIRASVARAEHPMHTLAVAFHGVAGIFPQRQTVAAAAQRLPRPGLYPSNINPKAVRIWDNVFKMEKYANAIAFKSPLQVWAIASRYFRDLCLNAGVTPYRDEHNPDFDLRDFVAERMRLVKSRLEQIYRHLDAGQIAVKQAPWKWTKFESDEQAFYIVATKDIRITAAPKVKIDDILRRFEGDHSRAGTAKSRGPVLEHMHYAVTPDSSVYLDYQSKQKRIIAEMHIQVPRGMVLKTLRLPRTKTTAEESRALKLLEALIHAWSHGELKAAVASVQVPQLSGSAYIAETLNRYLRTENAATAAAGSFHGFYTALLDSMNQHERLYFVSALQADPELMDQLHRFNVVNRRPDVVTAAGTVQLRTLTEMRVYKYDYLSVDDDVDDSTLVLPVHTVMTPRVDEDAEDEKNRDYLQVLHPANLHGAKVTLTADQRSRCADIAAEAETFEGSIAAAFEMLVEKFQDLVILRADAESVVKSLGPVDTWPFAGNRIWLHHLNMKSTHPGLTFDVVDAAGSKHLAAIYSGVW